MSSGAYPPLPNQTSIRVLKFDISHDGNGNKLHGSFVFFDLNDPNHQAYEALSYAWGDPTPVTHITFEGGLVIGVAQNLSDGLARLHRDGQSELIWIDAICIDQQSVVEKNPQVQMMSRIFAEATRVKAWLGTHDNEKTALALELLKKCANPFNDSSDGQETLEKMGGTSNFKNTPELYSAIGKLLSSLKPRSDFLNTFFKKSWFIRLWVCQEIWFGKNILLLAGLDVSIRYDILCRGMLFLTKGSKEMTDWIIAARTPILKLFEAQQEKQKLTLDKMAVFWQAKATEMKDYIFAVLPMMEFSLSEQAPIVVDYGKSVSEVFCDAARRVIYHTASLQELRVPNDLSAPYPSWSVPPFAHLATRPFAPRDTRPYGQLSGRKVHMKESRRADELLVEGRFFSSIGFADKGIKLSGTSMQLFDLLTQIVDRYIRYLSQHQKRRSPGCRLSKDAELEEFIKLDEAFMSLICQDIINSTINSLEQRSRLLLEPFYRILSLWLTSTVKDCNHEKVNDGHRAMMTRLTYGNCNLLNLIERAGVDKQKDFSARNSTNEKVLFEMTLFSTLSGFFQLDAGLFGMANHDIKVGDRLCALYGSEVLWILRQDDTGNHWQLISEAFVEPSRFNEDGYWETGEEGWISLI